MNLEDIIDRITNANSTSDIVAESIEGTISHFLGLSKDGDIILYLSFVNSNNSVFSNSLGKYLNVEYDCNIEFQDIQNDIIVNNNFCVLTFKNSGNINDNLLGYFLKLVEFLIAEIGDKPELFFLYEKIDNLRALFTKILIKSNITEIGIWGELFVILTSSSPEYLVKSWHINSNDKFDFNDGINILEVKTTTKQNREHNFSIEQLVNYNSNKIIICSIKTYEIENGKSVLDLFNEITSILSDEIKLIFKSKFFSVVGENLNKFNRKFDFNLSENSIAYYSPIEIPSIDVDHIQAGVSNVKFTSNLDGSKSFDITSVDSVLFKMLPKN